MMNMLKEMFRFKNLADVPFDKRKTILDDNSPIFQRFNEEMNTDRSRLITELKLNLAPSINSEHKQVYFE